MTGLSKDDVDAMEYMDDDDPRKTQYQTARKYAEVAIMQQIYAAQQEQQRRTRVLLDNHKKNIDGYNTFAQQEMQEPDFEQTKEFATNEFFESLPASQHCRCIRSYRATDCERRGHHAHSELFQERKGGIQEEESCSGRPQEHDEAEDEAGSEHASRRTG